MSIPSLSNLGFRSEMSSSSSVDQQISRAFYELCALLLTILRSPLESGPPPPRRQAAPARSDRATARRKHLTPVALASLLLGVSLALMLCGSVTFVIGFMLMPWVLGLVMVFYFVGIVSSLSGFGRAMLCPASSSGSRTSPKEMHGEIKDISFPRFLSFRLDEKQQSALKAMPLIAPKKTML